MHEFTDAHALIDREESDPIPPSPQPEGIITLTPGILAAALAKPLSEGFPLAPVRMLYRASPLRIVSLLKTGAHSQ